MWVKIKSRKISNEILEVPYSAYLNSYSKKGYEIVEDKTAKNNAVKDTDNSQNNANTDTKANNTKDDYEKIIEDIRINDSVDSTEIENKEKPKLTGNRGVKNEIPQRTPIKKPTVTKR